MKFKNRISAFSEFSGQKSFLKSKPAEINIEITSFCNLSCPMCGRVSKNTPSAYMSIELFKSIIDQVKGYAELVFLSAGVGEPISHPQLNEMLKYCEKFNLKTLVSTNATLLNEKKINLLLDNPPDQLILSLDGATKETHESIRIGSKFEKTMSNVLNLCKSKLERKLSKPFIIAQMIYMEENEAEAAHFYKKWKLTKGINAVRIKRMNFVKGSAFDKQDVSVVNIDLLKGKKNKQDLIERSPSCFYPWRQMVISAKGDIGLCCRDHNFIFKSGNIRNDSIENLWNSKNLMEARRLIAGGFKNKIDLCNGCDGIQLNSATGVAVRFFNANSIHKIAPMLETFSIKMKKKIW
ncbi:radical SAM protein [Candidatus Methylopumilus universalis]|uniref:radical SAM protein n=1 Tax=Candidatus Methylopumilus universalis TaxID=2588536 RepID=UPI001672DBC1|nr:radical SAM protein [Candidatus Methylopumilus universalis]